MGNLLGGLRNCLNKISRLDTKKGQSLVNADALSRPPFQEICKKCKKIEKKTNNHCDSYNEHIHVVGLTPTTDIDKNSRSRTSL